VGQCLSLEHLKYINNKAPAQGGGDEVTYAITRIHSNRQAADSLLCWETSEEMAPTAM